MSQPVQPSYNFAVSFAVVAGLASLKSQYVLKSGGQTPNSHFRNSASVPRSPALLGTTRDVILVLSTTGGNNLPAIRSEP